MFWVLHTMRGEFQQFNKYSCFTDGQPGAQNTMPTEKQLVGETSSVHFSKILPWPSSMYGAVLGSLQVLSQTPSCPKLATPQGCSDHPYPGLQMCRLRLWHNQQCVQVTRLVTCEDSNSYLQLPKAFLYVALFSVSKWGPLWWNSEVSKAYWSLSRSSGQVNLQPDSRCEERLGALRRGLLTSWPLI